MLAIEETRVRVSISTLILVNGLVTVMHMQFSNLNSSYHEIF